jgi:hypothetical protein
MGGETHKVGIIDEEEMDIRRVINRKTVVDTAPLHRVGMESDSEAAVTVLPRPGSTFFEFRLPHTAIGKYASVEVFALDGALVYRKRLKVQGVWTHFSWDNRGTRSSTVGRGRYVVRITAGAFRSGRKFLVS